MGSLLFYKKIYILEIVVNVRMIFYIYSFFFKLKNKLEGKKQININYLK